MNSIKSRRRPRLLAYGLGALGGALPLSGVLAQAIVMPETVVTATRVETPSERVGSTISVISAEQLQERQVRTVAEALRTIPGVAVNRSGGLGSSTQVRIRGSEANHTLVLIDGIEANDPAFGSSFDFAHLLNADLERIEILRGSQSALWGSDAVGGVVNLITRQGSGPPRLTVSGEAGSFGTRQLSAGLGGGNERYNYRLGGTRLLSDGESIAPGGSEEDGYQNTTLSLKAGVSPLSNLSLDITGRYVSATSQTDPQDFSFPPGPRFGQLIDGDDSADVDQFYGRAQAKLNLLDGSWEHIAGATLTDTGNDFFTGGIKTNTTDGRRLKYHYQTHYYFDTSDFAAASHTLSLLVEHEREEFRQRGSSPDAPQNQDQDSSSTAYVGQYDTGLWNRLFLTAAVRYDANDRFDNQTTYRLTGAYRHPDTQTRFHTSYGTGVVNPSFIELFGFFPRSFVGNPDLRPEQSKSWDIGVEQPFLDGRFTLDITYFHIDFEDEIVPTFDPVTFLNSVENSPGTSRRRGVELSARAELDPQLTLTGSYTYTASEDAEGEEEIRRPQHIASLTLNYRFLADRAGLNLAIDYNGRQPDFNFTTLPTSRVTLDGYTLVNLTSTYRINDKFEVFGRIENLLDQDYQEVFGYNTLGRAYYAGLKVSL